MNGKNSIFVIALWTLLLGPTLCGLGVMVHGCLGDVSTESHDEVQCSTDPCQILVVPASTDGVKPELGLDHGDHATPPAMMVAADQDLPALCSRLESELTAARPVMTGDHQTLPLLC
jgi:hypothetical protein